MHICANYYHRHCRHYVWHVHAAELCALNICYAERDHNSRRHFYGLSLIVFNSHLLLSQNDRSFIEWTVSLREKRDRFCKLGNERNHFLLLAAFVCAECALYRGSDQP